MAPVADRIADGGRPMAEMNASQVARIKKALAEACSGAPGVPHDEVVRWVESWDTEHELRKPKPPQ